MRDNGIKKKAAALVMIYNGIEGYPPTLNAITILSNVYNEVVVLKLENFDGSDFKFKDNVKFYTITHSAKTFGGRIVVYSSFIRLYVKLIKQYSFDLILFYDAIAAMTVYTAYRFLIPKPVLWYHNHDVPIYPGINKLRLLYWGAYFQTRLMKYLDIFSLPSEDRLKYFDVSTFKGKIEIIPNYPAKSLYHGVISSIQTAKQVKIIFQGTLDTGRGIEEIINILSTQIAGRDLKLILKGVVNPEYKSRLLALIADRKVDHQVEFYGFGPYDLLPEFTSACHIGIAIFTKSDIMNSTLGSASNKVYEYMACGLPFIYYDSPHFNKHFSKMAWAIPTDLSKESLVNSIEKIIDQYEELSVAAKNDFLLNRNYENVFTSVVNNTTKVS